MEFNSLTRRVAEATGADPAEIEATQIVVQTGAEAHGPDVGSAPAAGLYPRPRPRRIRARVQASTLGVPPSRTRTKRAASHPPRWPLHRASAAATAKINRAAYECIRDLATLKAWIAEANETGFVTFRTETNSIDPMQADLVGFSLALDPGRAGLYPAAASRTAPISSAAAMLEGQIPYAMRSRASSRCLPTGRAEDRPEHQIRLAADAPARRRRRAVRRHDADFLRARRRHRRPRHGRACGALSATSRSPSRMSRAPARTPSPSTASPSTRRPPMRPRTPTSPCGCGGC